VLAVERLSVMTQACGTNWALGMEACCRALLADGEAAEAGYREAIERLQDSSIRGLLARAHLYFGEWLWLVDRHDDAREHLGVANEMFARMGMEAFADTAGRKIGGGTRRTAEQAPSQLTAQEIQIIRLTRDGLSNAEMATRLFISPRTVEWHLSKIFSKLGITSRRQLRRVTAPDSPTFQD
jgi:DNA-binding CsgD family transcriptional regulator